MRFGRIGIALVGMLAATPALADCQTVRRFVQAQIDGSPPGDGSFVLYACRTEETSMRPLAEVEQKAHELADFPDHPERRIAELHLELHHAPRTAQERFAFGQNGIWFYERVAGIGTLRCSGNHDARWMLWQQPDGDGQLTIIGLGLPHSSRYNISRYRDAARDLWSQFEHFGLSSIQRPAIIESVECRGSNWTARLRTGPSDSPLRWELSGHEVGESAFIDSVANVQIGVSKPLRVWRFFALDSAGNNGIARVELLEQTDVKTSYVLESRMVMSSGDVASLVAVPTNPTKGQTIDFRDPATLNEPQFKNVPTLTWTMGPDGDRFAVESAGTSDDSTIPAPYKAAAPNHQRRFYLGVAIVIVVAGTASVLRVRSVRADRHIAKKPLD